MATKETKAQLVEELRKARAYVRLVQCEATASYSNRNRPLTAEYKHTDRDWGTDHAGERAHVVVRGEWYPFSADGGVVKVTFQPVNAADGTPCGAPLVEVYDFDHLWRLLRSANAEDPQWTAPGRDMLRALLQRDPAGEVAARPTLRYWLHQVSRDGTSWTAPECFEAVTEADVLRAIRAGWLHGDLRWATEDRTGRYIGGLDRKGSAMKAAPVDSYTIVGDGGRKVTVYAPMTRIVNPASHLRVVPVCGMATVQLAYDGATPMGWVTVTDEQTTSAACRCADDSCSHNPCLSTENNAHV